MSHEDPNTRLTAAKALGPTIIRAIQQRRHAATLRHAHLALFRCPAFLHLSGHKSHPLLPSLSPNTADEKPIQVALA